MLSLGAQQDENLMLSLKTLFCCLCFCLEAVEILSQTSRLRNLTRGYDDFFPPAILLSVAGPAFPQKFSVTNFSVFSAILPWIVSGQFKPTRGSRIFRSSQPSVSEDATTNKRRTDCYAEKSNPYNWTRIMSFRDFAISLSRITIKI